jgi:hypothetical protein
MDEKYYKLTACVLEKDSSSTLNKAASSFETPEPVKQSKTE